MIGLAMRGLAWTLEQVAGPWLKVLIVPGLALGALTLGHQMLQAREEARQAREAALIAQGREQCISEYELAAAEARASAAEQRARQAAADAAAAERITLEVQSHAAKLDADLAVVRAELVREVNSGVAVDASRCVSDRVLDLVTRPR